MTFFFPFRLVQRRVKLLHILWAVPFLRPLQPYGTLLMMLSTCLWGKFERSRRKQVKECLPAEVNLSLGGGDLKTFFCGSFVDHDSSKVHADTIVIDAEFIGIWWWINLPNCLQNLFRVESNKTHCNEWRTAEENGFYERNSGSDL